MEWLSANWEWVLLGFMVLEKLVKMSPSDKDDIILDVIVQGITKKGAILWAVGFIVKHSPSKEDDKMFAKIKKALD